MKKPTQIEVATEYARHLVPKEGLYIPDAEGIALEQAARAMYPERWVKRMKKCGWHLAAEERLAVSR